MKKSFLRSILSPFLAILSGFYFLGLQIDRANKSRFRKKLPRPVVSIGNITLGGSGKTPLLIKLVQDLKEMGEKVGVLSRNYRGGHAGPSVIPNDENLLLQERCPGVVLGLGANRAQQADKLLAEANPPTVFVLDDGFQHWSLERDCDIVCVDATDPWGQGALFPWGRRREPLSALARSSFVVMTRCELLSASDIQKIKDEIQHYTTSPAVYARAHFFLVNANGIYAPIDQVLRGKKALAVSAIGNPDAYEKNLRQLGVDVVPMQFGDHHAYREQDIAAMNERSVRLGIPIVMTEKDWMKVRSIAIVQSERPPLFILQQKIGFDTEDEALWRNVLQTLVKRA